MTALYNEIDPYAAEWLRNLIAAGHIAPGIVDERSIADRYPDAVARFDQCHFFAGIGVWSYALRAAGWPDDRPVWTGSCPCQPFSSAGKGEGHEDERHLWPSWLGLIRERRPATIFGEQVGGGDGRAWLDLVLPDLEDHHYAVAAADLPACGVGADHIRQRLFFVARGAGTLADAGQGRRPQFGQARLHDHGEPGDDASRRGAPGFMGDAAGAGLRDGGRPGSDLPDESSRRPATEWIDCRDGKRRRIESGTFPLASGLAAGLGTMRPELVRLAGLAGLDAASLRRAKAYRIGSLRGYGNAIHADVARTFIRAAMTA